VTSRDRLLTVLSGGVPDRVPVTAYEFSHLDTRRPREEPGYAAIAEMQREMGECFVPCGVDLGMGLGDPNVVTEGTDDPSSPQQQTRVLPTPKGDLVSVSRREPGTITWWKVKALLASPADCRKWLSIQAEPSEPDAGPVLEAQRKIGDEGMVIVGPGDALGIVCGLFDFTDFVTTLLSDESLILEMLHRVAAGLERGLRAVCSQVEGVAFRFWGPEYSGAPLLNPHVHFPKLVVDVDRDVFRIVNESGNFSVLHAHGRLADILDGIAQLSPSMLEPLELLPAATADVTLAEL